MVCYVLYCVLIEYPQAWLFSHPCTIDIQLDDEDHPQVEIPKEKGPEKLYLFIGNQPVKGKVTIEPHHGKKIEHKGIKIELIGQIGNSYILHLYHGYVVDLAKV